MEDYYSSTYAPHISGSHSKSPTKRALYRNQEESMNTTAYYEYPTEKPFINDNYRHTSDKHVSTSPENNRLAVISALKNLREKIRKLETERAAAETNLKSLAAETHRYKDILTKEPENVEPTQTVMSQQSQELESQLTAAETRSGLLEKQLQHMRKLVENADSDKRDAVTKSTILEKQQHQEEFHKPIMTFDPQAEKISQLEREQLKLTATQTLAEGKIRDLEEKIREERHQRQMMSEKTAVLETEAQTNRILMHAGALHEKRPTSARTKKVKKKKKASNKKQKTHPAEQEPERKREALKHYRLNLADIPFVAGKSSTPSHSVGANVQRVLSLMKSHNMALCSSADQCDTHRSSGTSSGSSSDGLDHDLAELLLQLQDEFGQMSVEHQELSKQINEVTDSRVRDDLERELDSLVGRMESKSQQISKVRKHQEKLDLKKKKKKSSDYSKKMQRPKSANTDYTQTASEVEVTTTIKTKGRGAGLVHVRPSSGREVSLNVLKDMRKLQTTLRRDDLHWE
ncbi:centrosomal protein of 57 kDa-like isoform X2 [Mizuhopecten yessoensis]|uniref:Centrosomal protein of 57 kDa n=1 Tax=Mizuhopecten yessoensis TaxID=6573 RepID=A0A210QB19_MIZYE|nr:centrosomal protein of 57 kDa-like isoform X2 [Mizuhopecten yessoensis]OWF45927.1 Centrosomal protein of 57 kDa [Mizuhopecten yessoensis]